MSDNLPGYDAWLTHDPRADYDESRDGDDEARADCGLDDDVDDEG
jgi:hypothetical protein